MKLDFSDFNEPTKTLLDNYLLLRQKKALGRTRGKFGELDHQRLKEQWIMKRLYLKVMKRKRLS
jgi:hypothetical protein